MGRPRKVAETSEENAVRELATENLPEGISPTGYQLIVPGEVSSFDEYAELKAQDRVAEVDGATEVPKVEAYEELGGEIMPHGFMWERRVNGDNRGVHINTVSNRVDVDDAYDSIVFNDFTPQKLAHLLFALDLL